MAIITPSIVNDELKDFKNPVLGAFVQFGNPIQKLDDIAIHREFMPWWLSINALNLTENRTGIIGGTVKVQGVLQNKARVSLYFRKTGQLIQSTFTNEIGVFEFRCGLNRNVADYYAVAITDQPFNAQVFDKLQPI